MCWNAATQADPERKMRGAMFLANAVGATAGNQTARTNFQRQIQAMRARGIGQPVQRGQTP